MSTYVIKEKGDVNKVINLENESVTIGRGAFLGVADKRVSRNHAIIKRKSEGIELRSIHVNPCFYTRENEPEKWLKLEKEESVLLKCGDTFSLLPKQFIYEIAIENDELVSDHLEIEESQEKIDENGTENKKLDESKTEQHSEGTCLKPPDEAKVKISISQNNKDQESSSGEGKKTLKKEFPVKRNHVTAMSNTSPSESRKRPSLDMTYTEEDGKVVAIPSTKKRKLPDWMSKPAKIVEKEPEASKTPSTRTPKSTTAKKSTPKSGKARELPKLDFSSDSESSGKMRTSDEPEEKESVQDHSKNVNESVSSSKEEEIEMVDEKIDEDVPDAKAPSSEKSDEQTVTNESEPRSPCAFGASCYRQNPQHRAELSHPGDEDYKPPGETDEVPSRPDCPYGTSCYRKNPLHKRQFKHTRRVAPKRTAKTRAARKNKDESSEDEYDLDDSFLNDDSDDDLDAGASEEEDSDWNPSQGSQMKGTSKRTRRNKKRANYKESDSEDSDEEEEDLDELVSNAKDFSRNRKMWKK